MILQNNPELIIPRFQGGSYSHYDRIFLPHDEIKLKSVSITNSGDLELLALPIDDGPEQWIDWIKFKTHDETKSKFLFEWLQNRIGQTIDRIFKSEFSFI